MLTSTPCTLADGSVYRGTWQSGRPHGRGTRTWPSGATFTGEWRGGLQHGVGALRSPGA